MDAKTQKLIKGYVIYKLKEAGALGDMSAYEQAVAQGYIGTEEQWIADINGTPDKVPYIGDNGNWFIDDVDMNIIATEYFKYIGNSHPDFNLSAETTPEELEEVFQEELDRVIEESKVILIQTEADIKEALLAEDDELSLGLIDDVTLSSFITIPLGKTVTFNLGGNTITATGSIFSVVGNLNLSNGSLVSSGSDGINIDGGSVILTNVNISALAGRVLRVLETGGNLTVNGGSFHSREMCVQMIKNANVVINSGEFISDDNGVLMDNGTARFGNNNLTVNGGYFEGRIQSDGYLAFVIHHAQSGIFNINGGTFKAINGAGFVSRAGELNVNNCTIICGNDESISGWVGDNKLQIGCYPLVYCEKAKYPAVDTLAINIGENVIFDGGVDGAKVQYLLSDNVEPNITGV